MNVLNWNNETNISTACQRKKLSLNISSTTKKINSDNPFGVFEEEIMLRNIPNFYLQFQKFNKIF